MTQWPLDSYRPTGKTDAEVKDLISILLLGTKYGAISLRKRTLAVLSRQFPPTLEQWDSRRFNVHFERNIFAIANVVRQCCAFSLLPTVLLHCYLRQTFNVLVGCGSVGATHELDPANEQAVLLAQQYLASQIQEDVFPDFFDFNLEVFGCHDVLRCCRAKGELNKRMKASPNNWIYDISTMEARLKKCDFCQTCNRVYIKYYADGRKKIWEELPQYFSLPPWSVLAAASEGYFFSDLARPCTERRFCRILPVLTNTMITS